MVLIGCFGLFFISTENCASVWILGLAENLPGDYRPCGAYISQKKCTIGCFASKSLILTVVPFSLQVEDKQQTKAEG